MKNFGIIELLIIGWLVMTFVFPLFDMEICDIEKEVGGESVEEVEVQKGIIKVVE